MRRTGPSVTAVGLAALATACGASPITAERLEGAIAPAFANLVSAQQAMMGLTPIEAAALRTSATCRRIGRENETRGAGHWQCTIIWFFPTHRGAIRDAYDLSVGTDGCYTATSEGAEGRPSGPTLTLRNGSSVTDVLYAFDGCFDPD